MLHYTINISPGLARIHKEIYGQFAEHLGRGIYEGIYVGEDSDIPNVNGMRCDVVNALRDIRVPVLRWPGGCFADEYHWRDGIGPKPQRKHMINTHWGGVTEDNSFGTHEFFELCRQLGCEAYVNGNVGSGTVQEMSEWVEYMTFPGISPMANLRKANGRPEPWDVAWFAVGNETWGCGGNMLPEHYAAKYRNYQTYVRNYNADKPVRKICSGANVDDYEWTEKVMETCFRRTDPELHGNMDGISLHYYVLPDGWANKSLASDFDTESYYKTLAKAAFMDELVTKHSAIMDRFDPEGKVGLIVDEWGTWYKVEPGTNPGFLYQQNTMRDAMVAALTLNIFNKHAGRVRMANIAQMVNVLQSMLLTDGDRMVKTPTYHVFDLFKGHQDAQLLESSIETEMAGKGEWQIPNLTESASIDSDGRIHITIANLDHEKSYEIETELTGLWSNENGLHNLNSGVRRGMNISALILSGCMHDMNTFDDPDKVTTKPFTDIQILKNGRNASDNDYSGRDASDRDDSDCDCRLRFTIPACSILSLELQSPEV